MKHKADQKFMRQALKMALKGYGRVSPNPMVGAVIVKNESVVSCGYHHKSGQPHAEIEAISNAKGQSLEGCRMYVNLEPCCHFGKTPPCTDAIIKSGIKRVIIAHEDPNPLVGGKGIQTLIDHGVEVTTGVLENKAKKMNEIFLKNIQAQCPFVALKLAMTLDGKIADNNCKSKWITNQSARKHVHHLRSGYDVLLTGAGTVRKDNPSYTVRYVKGKNPYRAILTTQARIPADHNIFNLSDNKTLILHTGEIHGDEISAKKILLQPESASKLPDNIIDILKENGFTSVFIEAGEQVSSIFLDSGLVDKIYFYYGSMVLGPGISPFNHLTQKSIDQCKRIKDMSIKKFKDSFLVEGYLE